MKNKIRIIRSWVLFFIAGLAISGLTAIPLQWEMEHVNRFFTPGTAAGNWMDEVSLGLADNRLNHPWIFYGFDWLAFAHIALAVFFIGLYRDPVKNKWVAEAGLLICLLLIPFAFIAGASRGIPVWWRWIDCSFGIIGAVPLLVVLHKIRMLEEAGETVTLKSELTCE